MKVSNENEKTLDGENRKILVKADELRGELKKIEQKFNEWKETVLQKSLKDAESLFNACIEGKDYKKAGQYTYIIDSITDMIDLIMFFFHLRFFS